MNSIPANINSIVSTDGSGGRVQGVGGSDEGTGSSNNSLSLPHHGNDGSRGQERDQSIEEALALVLSIVLLSNLYIHINKL